MTERIIPNASTLTGWRKSTYSNDQAGSCVEVLDNYPAAVPVGWRKSTHSGSEGGSCVEVLDNYPAAVPVRDSKAPHGPALVFAPAGWSAFVTALKTDWPSRG
ncbi:DUF397 domain-containing protein [Streptomyces sp. DSM 118878]